MNYIIYPYNILYLVRNANALPLRGLEEQAPDYKTWKAEQDKVKDWVSKKVDAHAVLPKKESYNIAPAFELHYGHSLSLHPLARKDLQDLDVDRLKQLTFIHFGKKYKDSTSLALDSTTCEAQKAFENRCLHRCFDTHSENEPSNLSDKGAFHSGVSDCFGDSEQAFLTFLEHKTDNHIIRKTVSSDALVSGVTVRLFSPRDICKFCRGTLSMALSNSTAEGKSSWLKLRLKDFLDKGEKLQLSTDFAVRLFGYSTNGISSERR